MRGSVSVKRSGLTANINELKRGLELVARMLADKGVKVVFRGTECATDHKTIYLPELSLLERPNMTDEEVDESNRFLDALRGFLFHEVAHILFTDRAEVGRALARGHLHKVAFNVVEDVRIEQRMGKLWRGAGVSLQRMHEWMFKKVATTLPSEPLVGKVLVGAAWLARSGEDHWFYQQLDDATKVLLKKFAPEIRAARNLDDTAAAARLGDRIVAKLKALGEGEKPAEEQPKAAQGSAKAEAGEDADEDEDNEADGGSGGSGDDDGDDAGESEDGDEGEHEEEAGEADGGSGDDAGDDADDADASGEGGEGGAEGEEDADDAVAGGSDDGDGDDGEAEAEAAEKLREELNDPAALTRAEQMNDARHGLGAFIKATGSSASYLPYTTEFDRVSLARETTLAEYNLMMAEGRKHFGILKRNLQNLLRARAQVLTLSELEEGELDTSLLYKLASGRSDRVFKEDLEHFDTNVAVCLLVNESGSMGSWAGVSRAAPTAPPMSRIGLARVTAALMGEVLDSLGIAFAVYGHTTGNNATDVFWSADETAQSTFTRWGATVINVYKDFDESFKATKARIPGMAASGNTHDGEALLFAGNRLLSQRTVERRILMTLDDGVPEPNMPSLNRYQAGKYVAATLEGQRNIGRMGEQHCDYVNEVVASLKASKVEVLGMGMGSDSVRRFYERNLVVYDVAAFPALALKELRQLLSTKK